MAEEAWGPAGDGLRRRLYVVIFESDTPAGKAFDVALIVAILASVFVVMADSIPDVHARHGEMLWLVEVAFTILFTVEYLLRLYVIDRPSRYARSFFGLVDLFSVLPTYLAILLPGSQYLLTIRVLRVLRVFRVLKLAHLVGESHLIMRALWASRGKIGVFLFAVLTVVVVLGSLLYVVEGADSGFDSIPRSIYWAIVTVTTVGYGDIAPATPFGQAIAAMIMLFGYAMIAVPTGIVTVEMNAAFKEAGRSNAVATRTRVCPECGGLETDALASFCRFCGRLLGRSAAGKTAPTSGT